MFPFSAEVYTNGLGKPQAPVAQTRHNVRRGNITLCHAKYLTQWRLPFTISKGSSTAIAFGILLNGPGEVWLNSANIEVVGPGVAVTDQVKSRLDQPTNLSFER